MTAVIDTPVGPLGVETRGGAVTGVTWHAKERGEPCDVAREAAAQLRAYFDGRLTRFDLPLAPKGSPFELEVFAQMQAIPFGETRAYGEIAATLGTYGQPVGRACGRNPIPVIIPCHRVLSAEGL
ncbi:MAG: methylated-DNA--[protein]-cysteine S-methyltransferase, partial [Pseudomonadota bacterium]